MLEISETIVGLIEASDGGEATKAYLEINALEFFGHSNVT